MFVSNLSFTFLSISNAYKLQDSNEAGQLAGETMHYSYVLSVPLLLGFEQNGSKNKVNFDFNSDETSRLMGEKMHCTLMPSLCVYSVKHLLICFPRLSELE